MSAQQVKGQSFGQLMDFADQKVVERDYYYAIHYYEKAMQIDSNSVEILWKYAEALRLYKNYPRAEMYYQKVYKKEESKIYPYSIFWLATMQQYNGKYSEALENWKKAKKVFKKDRDSYEYIKSQQEIKNCLWAVKAVRDTADYIVNPLPPPVNTENAEFAPVIYKEHLYFTSLQADSINHIEEVYTVDYSLQIYSADQQDSIFNNVGLYDGTKKKGMNSANGSFSPDGSRFYFSRCNNSYECKIYVGKVKDNKIVEVDSLGEIINEPGKISTMPHCTMIDGQEVLFFASNIEKNYGGFDIWYSIITNGNQYSLPKSLGPGVNSMDDEISPFYDPTEKKLYFSSNWHAGFGGMDIFYVTIDNWEFSEPVNMGLPINSTKNDTYFIIDPKTDTYYFSSNREGVLYAKNPTCCNDIFSAYLPKTEPPNRFESLEDLNKKLPVTLYFHNDEPDPKNKRDFTTKNYLTTYYEYKKLIPKYKDEYAAGLTGDKAEEAKEDIEDFFTQYVDQGVLDLQEFTRLLLIELEKGYEIEVTVKGFASPLAPTDYNVHLTRRRISSLVNYLRDYEGGVFVPYMDGTAANGGRLTFVQTPFGEYKADLLISDNPNDQQNSIYNRRAALERKIEIVSVSLITQDSIYAEMKFDEEGHNFGYTTKGQKLVHTFSFTNTGDDTLTIERIESDCACLTYEISQMVLAPGESGTITITFITDDLNGITNKNLLIYSNIKGPPKELTVMTDVK